MDVNNLHIFLQKKIKVYLVFFCLLLLLSCQQNNSKSVVVNYQNDEAISVEFSVENSKAEFTVVLNGNENAILGDFNQEQSQVVFTPVIPFTKGEKYQVLTDGQILYEFSIEKNAESEKPILLSIQPELDTVPENLLKMYFTFSKPMQESKKTLDFIKVIEIESQKEVSPFLYLENELWNLNRTQLTLWLDPGRIKKGLIPNQEKGIPLEGGKTYEITVSSDLQDATGETLEKNYNRKFFIGKRDEQKPSLKLWKKITPKSGTKEAFSIDFQDYIDVNLIEDLIQTMTETQEKVEGKLLPSKDGSSFSFIPVKQWKTGYYSVKINANLEDLAGNNMNRLFDNDLENDNNRIMRSSTYSLSFQITE